MAGSNKKTIKKCVDKYKIYQAYWCFIPSALLFGCYITVMLFIVLLSLTCPFVNYTDVLLLVLCCLIEWYLRCKVTLSGMKD